MSDASTGDTAFSSFSVSGVSGDDEDVFIFTPLGSGASTSGTFAPALLFDGSAFGLALEDIDGFDMTPLLTAPAPKGIDDLNDSLSSFPETHNEWTRPAFSRFRTNNYMATTGFSILSNIHRFNHDTNDMVSQSKSVRSTDNVTKIESSDEKSSNKNRLDHFFMRYDNILTSDLLDDVLM